MSRNPSPTTAPVDAIVVSDAAVQRVADTQDALAAQELEATNNARAVAVQMGYEGSLTVGAVEDEIRFYQKRTVEAILETGKRLLILRELTSHGNSSQNETNDNFSKRVELLGFSRATAYRFMRAASKTAKSAILADLSKQAKNGLAFLELVTHDDDALEALKDMDDIDRMSATQLREALRQEKENTKFIAEKRDKESARADSAEKTLRAGGPQARKLEDQVSEFSKDVSAQREASADGILNLDQQIRGLDKWLTEYAVAQPGYDPEARFDMPVEVMALVQKLHADINSIASAVGGLQHLFYETFGGDLETATTYHMQAPGTETA